MAANLLSPLNGTPGGGALMTDHMTVHTAGGSEGAIHGDSDYGKEKLTPPKIQIDNI